MTSESNDLYPDKGAREDGATRPGKGEKTATAEGGSTTEAYDAIAYDVRVNAIKHLIEAFGERHLTREYTTYALNLCDKVSLTPDLDILRGQKSIWAAALVHVMARLNLLFDTNSDVVLTPALICSHFKTVKSTVGNRASQIQKVCGLVPGARGFCRQEKADVKPGGSKQMNLFND
ncbi:MAG: DUF6398 domain-containing protein [Deltaproteobacteria bacterium]|nr:DUF6398 domain-containing protein [Deltaproteobacteria bacterium]